MLHKAFRKKEPSGPLSEFLIELENHRGEAIYNYDYKYIKQIIWDDEKNEKYGNTREGYERFKSEEPGYMSYGGVTSLRVNSDRDGVVLGYMTETKNQTNRPLDEIRKIYDRAVEKFCELIGSTDTKVLKYWLDEEIGLYHSEANGYMYAIKELEGKLSEYAYDEDFKEFIDRIK